MSSWKRLHWSTRIATLGVLVAILLWQSRYTWSVHNPMYGWPMSFKNVPDQLTFKDQWRPLILILDAAVWLAVAAGVGYITERWQRKPKRWQYSAGNLLGLQGVLAVLLSVGCIEEYLRFHPNCKSLFPRYARWEWGGVSVWFDIGLFTDPPQFWALGRIVIIIGIGCAVYSAGSLLCFVVSHIRGVVRGLLNHDLSLVTQLPETHGANPVDGMDGADAGCARQDPAIARVVIWILLAIVAFLLLTSLPPTAIR